MNEKLDDTNREYERLAILAAASCLDPCYAYKMCIIEKTLDNRSLVYKKVVEDFSILLQKVLLKPRTSIKIVEFLLCESFSLLKNGKRCLPRALGYGAQVILLKMHEGNPDNWLDNKENRKIRDLLKQTETLAHFTAFNNND